MNFKKFSYEGTQSDPQYQQAALSGQINAGKHNQNYLKEETITESDSEYQDVDISEEAL